MKPEVSRVFNDFVRSIHRLTLTYERNNYNDSYQLRFSDLITGADYIAKPSSEMSAAKAAEIAFWIRKDIIGRRQGKAEKYKYDSTYYEAIHRLEINVGVCMNVSEPQSVVKEKPSYAHIKHFGIF